MAEPPTDVLQKSPKFTELNDLVLEKVGGQIVFATDDWFAVAENLLKVLKFLLHLKRALPELKDYQNEDPVFKAGVFTEYGKWMDGWETRRKRIPGHDWCIIQLGVPGTIRGVDIDTSFFTGNYSPKASIQAACLNIDFPKRSAKMGTAATPQQLEAVKKLRSEEWETIIPRTPLNPGYKTSCHNFHEVHSQKRWTHIRLNMYPDGGIARLRVYGRAEPDWGKVSKNQLLDLIAVENGGMCIGYSNVHFGHARNLIQPGRAETMADGWETARKPGRPSVLVADSQGILQVPGSDWCVFRMGHPGIIVKIEIDTNHFKGNYPDSCRIEGCLITEQEESGNLKIFHGSPWKTLLPVKKLSAHKQHVYGRGSITNCGVISHIRLTMAPDGGISRMRLWGYIQSPTNAKL